MCVNKILFEHACTRTSTINHMKVPVGLGDFNRKYFRDATHCSTFLIGGTVSLDFKRLCKKSLIQFLQCNASSRSQCFLQIQALICNSYSIVIHITLQLNSVCLDCTIWTVPKGVMSRVNVQLFFRMRLEKTGEAMMVFILVPLKDKNPEVGLFGNQILN